MIFFENYFNTQRTCAIHNKQSLQMTKIIESQADIMGRYDPAKNTTRPALTKYERAMVIGMRLEQLARGAPSLLDEPEALATGDSGLREIVLKELALKLIPYIVIRPLPNGKKEYWRLKDMEV